MFPYCFNVFHHFFICKHCFFFLNKISNSNILTVLMCFTIFSYVPELPPLSICMISSPSCSVVFSTGSKTISLEFDIFPIPKIGGIGRQQEVSHVSSLLLPISGHASLLILISKYMSNQISNKE